MNESLIEAICLEFRQMDPITGYRLLPPLYRREEHALQCTNPESVYRFNRTIYARLLRDFSLDDAFIRLPESTKALYSKEVDRLESKVRSSSIHHFQTSNDSFRKDLAILTHRLVPCGAEFFYPYGGIPRSLAIRSGLTGLTRFLAATWALRGLKPLLELHLHSEVLDAFTPEGWLNTYENLADVLGLNPQFLGVQSFSWFLDPALEWISPHLAYLRQVPEQCGAYIFYSSDEPPLASAAVHKSQKRRSLAATGKYQPKIYARVWPRKALLKRLWRHNAP